MFFWDQAKNFFKKFRKFGSTLKSDISKLTLMNLWNSSFLSEIWLLAPIYRCRIGNWLLRVFKLLIWWYFSWKKQSPWNVFQWHFSWWWFSSLHAGRPLVQLRDSCTERIWLWCWRKSPAQYCLAKMERLFWKMKWHFLSEIIRSWVQGYALHLRLSRIFCKFFGCQEVRKCSYFHCLLYLEMPL